MASVATAPAGSTRAASSPGDGAAEVRLLGDAQSEMRAGEPERALLLFDEHARRYPKGALGEERDAARIGALCALGRISEAREATDRFLRAAPLSPHAGPLRASCGGSPAAPASNF
jgi:outer membrane protein assembly factor BamD (BamD/ComL family)